MFRNRHTKHTGLRRGLALVAVVGLGGALAACSPAKASRDYDDADIAAYAGKKIDRALKQVDASDEQREQIKVITDRLVADGLAMRGDKGEVKAAFHAQWGADEVDSEALHGLVDDQIAEYQTMAHKVVDAMAEIHAILTPEQRAELEAMMEEKASRHHRGDWHGKHGGKASEL